MKLNDLRPIEFSFHLHTLSVNSCICLLTADRVGLRRSLYGMVEAFTLIVMWKLVSKRKIIKPQF